jgi:hypothetical protein
MTERQTKSPCCKSMAALLRLTGPFGLPLPSPGTGESGARARLAFRILERRALDSVATSVWQLEQCHEPATTNVPVLQIHGRGDVVANGSGQCASGIQTIPLSDA